MTTVLDRDVRKVVRFRIEKRHSPNVWVEVLAVVVALVASLAVGAAIIATSDAEVGKAFGALFQAAFGSWKGFWQTLVQATPMIFTGLATVVAFRAKIWNIGGEGQFFAGAMMAAWISINFSDLPRAILLPLIIAGSMVAGALWAGIAGYLKARFAINEIIVTVMLNYIIQFLLSYLLVGPWKDPSSHYLHTIAFSESTYFPTLFNTKLHVGFVLALIMAGLVFVLLWRTPLGYEIRAIGVNLISARYKGIDVKKIIILTMLLSGALAGLGGGTEISGVYHRLRMDISIGYGFTGILIAMMARLHPFGVILAAIFFGALVNGSYLMQIKSGVPVALVHMLQGIVLFFLIIAFVSTQYRVRRVQVYE